MVMAVGRYQEKRRLPREADSLAVLTLLIRAPCERPVVLNPTVTVMRPIAYRTVSYRILYVSWIHLSSPPDETLVISRPNAVLRTFAAAYLRAWQTAWRGRLKPPIEIGGWNSKCTQVR